MYICSKPECSRGRNVVYKKIMKYIYKMKQNPILHISICQTTQAITSHEAEIRTQVCWLTNQHCSHPKYKLKYLGD